MHQTRNWLLSLLFLISIQACQTGSHTLHGSPYDPPSEAPEIVASNTTAATFRLSDQRGGPVLLFFGYTSCPDVCPATLGKMTWVFEQLGERADRATFAFISVDPQRDSLERLERHLEHFDPRFIGLRLEGQELAEVMEDYGVHASKATEGDGENYLVTHTARIFLIDSQGRLRTNYDFETPKEEILADLENLLQD
jgi:protein SCO1/2